MNIKKKITLKEALGKSPEKNPAENYHAVRFIGEATDAVGKSNQYGEFVVFKGTHKAINIQTGEEIHSPNAILPGLAESLLFSAVSAAKANTPSGSGSVRVQYGFDAYVNVNESAARGYEFEIVSLLENEGADPLALLEAEIDKNAPLALPAKKDKK